MTDMLKGNGNTGVGHSNTVVELLDRFRKDGRIAITCGSGHISYRGFIRAYENFGKKLVGAGLKKGE